MIDGFVENGVSLYGADKDLNEEETVPGLVAQNVALWSAFPESAQKYLFVGDSELWFFAYEIASIELCGAFPFCDPTRFIAFPV